MDKKRLLELAGIPITEARLAGDKDEQRLVAEFVEEGLTGLGYMDDAADMFWHMAEDNNIEFAVQSAHNWNALINFVNRTLNKNITTPYGGDQIKRWVQQWNEEHGPTEDEMEGGD